MLSGDMAKSQIEDRLREAHRDRVARAARAGKGLDRAPLTRRVGSGLLAAVAWAQRSGDAPRVARTTKVARTTA